MLRASIILALCSTAILAQSLLLVLGTSMGGMQSWMWARVPRGRYVMLPITDKTRGHGTHSLPAIWKPYPAEFLAGLTPR